MNKIDPALFSSTDKTSLKMPGGRPFGSQDTRPRGERKQSVAARASQVEKCVAKKKKNKLAKEAEKVAPLDVRKRAATSNSAKASFLSSWAKAASSVPAD